MRPIPFGGTASAVTSLFEKSRCNSSALARTSRALFSICFLRRSEFRYVFTGSGSRTAGFVDKRDSQSLPLTAISLAKLVASRVLSNWTTVLLIDEKSSFVPDKGAAPAAPGEQAKAARIQLRNSAEKKDALAFMGNSNLLGSLTPAGEQLQDVDRCTQGRARQSVRQRKTVREAQAGASAAERVEWGGWRALRCREDATILSREARGKARAERLTPRTPKTGKVPTRANSL